MSTSPQYNNMPHRILQHLSTFVYDHQDSLVTVGSGLTLSLSYWLHTEPALIVGKIIMTFILGLVGGIGGYTAKRLCSPKKHKRHES